MYDRILNAKCAFGTKIQIWTIAAIVTFGYTINVLSYVFFFTIAYLTICFDLCASD